MQENRAIKQLLTTCTYHVLYTPYNCSLCMKIWCSRALDQEKTFGVDVMDFSMGFQN